MAPKGHARGSRRLATALVAALASVSLAGCESGGGALPLVSSSASPSGLPADSSTTSTSPSQSGTPAPLIGPLIYPGKHPGPRLQALIDQVQTGDVVPQRLFVMPPGPHETYLCQVGIYGHDGAGTLYADVLCANYTTGPEAKMQSASQLDVVLSVRGTGADTRIVGYRTPDQATIQQDYERMFPPRILAIIHAVQSSQVPDPLRPTLDQILVIAQGSA